MRIMIGSMQVYESVLYGRNFYKIFIFHRFKYNRKFYVGKRGFGSEKT